MITLGQVSFMDMPDSTMPGPSSIITVPDSSSSSLSTLAIVAGVAIFAMFFLRRGASEFGAVSQKAKARGRRVKSRLGLIRQGLTGRKKNPRRRRR